jgi:peptidyl-prolyl cis-trans isomerase D
MLLSLMRRHAKSYLIKFLIGIIAVVFIFYFGYSFKSKSGIKMAVVNGEMISGLEYQKTYRNLLETLQKEYKSVWSDNLIKVFDLKNRALETLITQKLVSQEARRIGLDVTEKEIQEQILSYPAFQTKGRFDESRYRSLLNNNRMKPEDFEATIAQDLLQNKVEQFLMSFSPVTDQDVLDHYTYANEKVKVSFVKFLPETFRDAVKLDQAPMEAYFNEHKEDYRIPEKIKIAYIVLDPDQFAGQVKVSDRQVKDYYEENIASFKVKKEIRARHILFKLEQGATEEDAEKVKARAMSVLKKARNGGDFADLAKQYSEGPTKEDGGDLGYFSAGQMVKPFEEAAFKLEKGKISDLVRTSFGYHIIKVEDIKEARTKDLEEVREQISKSLSGVAAADLVHEKALSLIDQMPYDVNLIKYAGEHDVAIKESGYFSQDEDIPEIGGDEKLLKSIFSLQADEVSELIEFKNKFYIIQVSERKPSYLPDVKEVDKLKEDYRSHLAGAEAKSAAEGYLAELGQGKSWVEVSKKHGLTPETTDFFTRAESIPKIGYVPDLQETAFGLDGNKRYPDKVFESPDGVIVLRWEEYQGIDEVKYGEEKERYRLSLQQARQKTVLRDWLGNLRKMAEIEIVHPVDT